MKRFSISVWAVAIFVLATLSCSEPVELATVEYYITASASGDYESLNITFDYTRAYQEGSETGTTAIRTVYLDKQVLSLITNGTQEPIFLGASEIEPGKVYGYDFSFSSISVTSSGIETPVLLKEYNESNKIEKEFVLIPGEVKKVVFTISTDESLLVLPNNDLKFLAKIHY